MPSTELANSAKTNLEARSTATSDSADRGMKKPSVLISHPTGNQNLRNALRSLAENEMLAEFWTTIAWDCESRWNRFLPAGLRTQFARRAYADAPKERIHRVP
ncbi:MAG: hypothetical protein WBE56_02190, partial [Terracidiphilus sp.]